uniref:Retrovirus-related Pol polyprotein from transposon TNT 1-94 n=1 Tax=Tanacetum cinerariifolium TaxID=118510 RepID=A0A6L2LA20_TANCI|nr:retrovirus-related Pol polyprotein from transposon TNT 1-94 [Tanacetum cinerariifolium]
MKKLQCDVEDLWDELAKLGLGIKREFSVARTPQYNGVAERKNKTLIDATSTNRLHETLWVSCDHLNTRDYLGMFDEKADERFFIGYYGVRFQTNGIARTKDNIVAGIKREFSVARTPQYNGVAERKNKTLIDAVRTMDYLGMFDEKADERFFIGYYGVRFQTNGIARTKDNIVAGPKDSVVDAGKKANEVDKSQVLDNGRQDDQVTRSEFEGLLQQERQTEHINSTNSFNTISSPVYTVRPSFVNAASQSPINVAGTPAKEEVDMNNVVSSYIILDAHLTKFLKDHPEDQVFRNKKDERGIVLKNKARLVAHGHTQEEGIDYDKVFVPVARIEAIRLFLAYASFKNFDVYKMDVKSAFLYGKIEEWVIYVKSYIIFLSKLTQMRSTSLVESDIQTNATMADNRTMAQMLQAPIEGYEDAIVTLINLVQSNQFTERQDPHNHLRFFNKFTSTFRHLEVPNTTVKLLLFPFSLEGEARIWLDKEPPRSILTWEDLVSKFINQFFPPSKTTYLCNEITNFLQNPTRLLTKPVNVLRTYFVSVLITDSQSYISWILSITHSILMIRTHLIQLRVAISWIKSLVNVYLSLKAGQKSDILEAKSLMLEQMQMLLFILLNQTLLIFSR